MVTPAQRRTQIRITKFKTIKIKIEACLATARIVIQVQNICFKSVTLLIKLFISVLLGIRS